jgi:3-hydroxyacyl-CoA dehydrogenase/enoyl-CoA hydratase/3-hydroxybutyryl-CoA epimerase
MRERSAPRATTSEHRRAGVGDDDTPASRHAPQGAPVNASVRRDVRADGICVLTFDRPGSTGNILDFDTLAELAEHLEFIEAHSGLKGLVLTSAKPTIFCAGADLNVMRRGEPLAGVRRLIDDGQEFTNRIAALPIPTAAALHGAALGGGCEICLACDHRIASAERATRIGLPETQLGLLPAWGGSTRLPRLIGLRPALDVILGGKPMPPRQALEAGVVDELVPRQDLLETAIRRLNSGKRPPSHQRTPTKSEVAALAATFRRKLGRRSRSRFPALLKALEVMSRGVTRSVAASLALERRALLQLVQTDTCRNLIHLFFLEDRAKKRSVPGLEAHPDGKPIQRAAVIGAGTMGAGIAQWLSARRIEVALRDVTDEQIARGTAHITRVYQESVAREAITPQEMADGLARIHVARSDVPVGKVELVVEAAFEEMAVKKEIFLRLDAELGPDVILATNTSALPISELAAATRHPERVVGLHFFNPVHRMQLAELIPARQTAPGVLQRTLRFAQRIGKLPVPVQDVPGFVSNRVLTPYLSEAQRLFESGASIADLDAAMLEFGMPMGPMRLLDKIGLAVELRIAETLAARFGPWMQIPACLGQMVAAGLLGRKCGRGYYLYESPKQPEPNPATAAFKRAGPARTLGRKALQNRMIFVMVNEAARCLQEQVAADADDIDFVMVKGMGFAPFRGGLLRHADTVGAAKLVRAMERLAGQGELQFAPCDLLKRMAAQKQRFYNDY